MIQAPFSNPPRSLVMPTSEVVTIVSSSVDMNKESETLGTVRALQGV